MDEEYELLPHKKVEELKKEVDKYKENPFVKENVAETLQTSILELTKAINQMTQVFKEVKQEILQEHEQGIGPDTKLDKVLEQNKHIANALINFGEKIDELSLAKTEKTIEQELSRTIKEEPKRQQTQTPNEITQEYTQSNSHQELINPFTQNMPKFEEEQETDIFPSPDTQQNQDSQNQNQNLNDNQQQYKQEQQFKNQDATDINNLYSSNNNNQQNLEFPQQFPNQQNAQNNQEKQDMINYQEQTESLRNPEIPELKPISRSSSRRKRVLGLF